MPDIENLLNIEDEVTQVLSDLGVNEKLAEMDDFMNQNELKVNITNENATVTGLVTYTCTVKDKDNNALSNRVVEWYKGTTLLGLDATDSNGISTFSHRVTEADIYDVHAVVRGTHAGDDIRMFVKDKTNLFPVNIWSGGEYSNSTTGISVIPSGLTISTDYATNGNTSFKVTKTKSANEYLATDIVLDELDITQSAHVSGDINLLSGSCGVAIRLLDENNNVLSSEGVTITSSSAQHFTVTCPLVADTNSVRLFFNYAGVAEDVFYVDNLNIYIQ